METPCDNPWRQLPNKFPFVLSQEAQLIEQFNSTAIDRFKVHLEILPEPYLGNPDAPVVLLGLNPGFKESDIEQHRDARFAALSRANLLHEPAEYPFYLLDPTIDRTKWWERKLRCLIEQFGCLKVAREVFCVEFFPYHSRRFRQAKVCVPSQQYSFSLVKRAISRGAVILQLRGNNYWLRNVPELAKYQVYRPNSVQNPSISPRNFPEGYKAAVAVLEKIGSPTSPP
jgi:hypothetical protein